MKKLCRRLSLGLPLFLLVFAASAQTSSAVESENLYGEAVQSLGRGDYFTAQNQLESAINLDSANQKAGLELLRIYFAQKNFEGAVPLAKHLVKIDPNNENNLIALADIYKATEDLDGLLEVFSKLMLLSPDNPNFYYDNAFTLSLKSEFKQSHDLYAQIEKKFGKDDKLFIARKDLFLRENKPEKAIDEAKAFLAFKPESSQAALMLANVYLDLEKPQDALEILMEAEKKFTDEGFIPLTKADAYKMLGKEEGVMAELKKAMSNSTLPAEIKIRGIYNILQGTPDGKVWESAEELSEILIRTHPEKASAQAVYGDIQRQKQNIENALAAYRKAVSLDPSMDFVWEQLLQLEVSVNELQSAQKNGVQAIGLFPDNANIQLFTGYAFLIDQKHKEARTYLEGALNQANPSDENLMIEIYSSLGDVYNGLNMSSASSVAYEEALKIDSTNTYVLNNFAYYLALRKEELSKAAAMSKRSNELSQDNPSYLDTYAWVLFQQGKYTDALEWIEKAIRHSESPSATLIEHKGDILFKLGKRNEAIKLWQKALQSGATGNNEKLNQKIKERIYVD